MPHPTMARRVHGGGKRVLYDDFSGAGIASWWTTALGTLATSSGALRASAIASDGYNRITNPEFTTNTTGWIINTPGVTFSRVDSSSDPGTDSTTATSVDKWVVKITSPGVDGAGVYFDTSVIPGASYITSALAYSPSANVQEKAAQLVFYVYGDDVSADDTWELLSVSGVSSASYNTVYARCLGTTVGDIVYFDKFSFYLKTAIAYANLSTPNVVITASVTNPETAVTPRAILFRVTDALNYVRLLLYPNTAGNDTILQTVTAGVIADVASGTADVDWTSNSTDKVRVIVSGNTYIVEHMKNGASTWTTAFITTTASFNTVTRFGVQVFATSDNSFADIHIQAA